MFYENKVNISTTFKEKCFITLLYFINLDLILATFYIESNSTDVFRLYKEKYNKFYDTPQDEKNGLTIFVKNLNAVDKLNEISTDNKTFYTVNQYADLDTGKIEECFALRVKPYNNVYDTEGGKYLSRQKASSPNVSELYDLSNATELYKDYLTKFKKRNYTKNYDYTLHFYRFVKTLIELNKNNFFDNESKTLDANSDVIRKPSEYFD